MTVGRALRWTVDKKSKREFMDLERNKRTVRQYLSHFGRSDVDAVLDMMTDDATWWVNGRFDLYPAAGTKSKAEMDIVWRNLYGLIEGGLEMELHGIIAEGDRVAAEVRSHAVTKSGKVYNNDYHLLFILRGDLISEVKEYTDLLHAEAVFS